MTVKERHYWKFIKQILFLLNYILFIIKICQMCKIKSHWMFSVVFFMFYICVICDCVCVLKYAIYLIWPRQFSFGPDSSHLAHVFLIWLIPWPEQKMSQRGPWHTSNCLQDIRQNHWTMKYRSCWPSLHDPQVHVTRLTICKLFP